MTIRRLVHQDEPRAPTPAEQLAGTSLFDQAPPWQEYGPGYLPPPRARATDPETSHIAAERYAEHAWDQHPIIEGVLKGMGAAGGTIHEIAACLGDPWTAVMVARRMPELEDAQPQPRAHRLRFNDKPVRRDSPTLRLRPYWAIGTRTSFIHDRNSSSCV